MIARYLAVMPFVAALAAAAELEQASDLQYIRPAGWERSVDDESHLVVLTPPGKHAAATFVAGQDFSGTADAWHRGLWDQLGSGLKLRAPATEGQRGDIEISWAAFDKPDGTQSWLCLYTFVRNGRGEGVLYFADGETPFRANRAAVDLLIDGLKFTPPATAEASQTPPATAAGDEASGQAPSELVVNVPPGWTQKVDAKSKVIFMRPPDAKVTSHSSDVEIVVMPAQDFAGTAEEWQDAAQKFAQHGGRLLEPVQKTSAGSLLVSKSHLVDAAGTEQRQVIYTARWDTRAQMFVFTATRDDAFTKDGPVADRAITQIVVPGAANAAPAGQTTVADANDLAADGSRGPPAGTFQPSSAGADPPAELTVDAPPGWTVQRDPKNGSIYMKPPDSPAINQAGLMVLPAMAYADTAEEFHQQTLTAVLGQSRLLEPAHNGVAGGFLATEAHFQTPKGGILRAVVYTARWANRAQAVVFVTSRDDLFRNNAMAANAAVLAVHVPGAPPAAPAAAVAPGAAAPGSMTAASPANAPAGPALGASADAGDTMPVLDYRDPPNFWRGGGKAFAEYQGSDINFTLCVYPFREFQGDARAAFQQNLLRDWIDVMYREEGVAGPPQYGTYQTPGADTAIGAKFLDGRQQQHFRLLLVAGHWAAIVDMIAPTAFAYQKGFSSAVQLLDSMKVGRKAAPPSLAQGPGPQGAALAGLFQGMKNKFTVNLMLGPGYGSPKLALHYYLFSADGRVYRCYDFPPGGSAAAARQFDFDGAERQDPGNTGRFAVRGNELYIKMGGPQADEITTTVADPNALQLDGVAYQRKS